MYRTRYQGIAARLSDPATAAAAREDCAVLLVELAARARVPEERDADVLDTFALAAGEWADACLGDAETALSWLREARTAVDRNADSPWAPWLDYEILATLARKGDLVATVRDGEALLKEPSAGPYSLYSLYSLALVASAQRALTRFDAAERTLNELEKRLAAARAHDPSLPRAEAARLESLLCAGRAQIAQELGCPDRAATLVETAESLARESGSADAIAEALLRRADLSMATERFARVEHDMEEAMQQYRARFSATQRAQLALYRSVARIELEQMDPERPRHAADDLSEVIADASLPERDRRIAQMCLLDLLLRTGDRKAAAEVATALRARLHGATDDVRALTQLGRAALVLESNPEPRRRAFAELEEAYHAFLATVKQLPPRPGGLGFLHDSRRRQMVGTLIQLARAVDDSGRGTERALALVLEAEGAGTLTRRVSAGPVTLADVQSELLGPRDGALVYVPSNDVTHVFAVDQERILYVEIAHSATELRARLDPLRKELLTRDVDVAALRGPAREAARVLLPPAIAERIATWSTLTVTGTQIMLDVPFECLVLEDGSMLGLQHAIATLPSLPLGVGLARRAPAPVAREQLSMHLYATLTPTSKPVGPMLEAKKTGAGAGSDREMDAADAQRLTHAFALDRCTTVLGPSFTRAALARDDLRDVDILHLIAHGDQDFRAERPSSLLVHAAGDDGRLRCPDIDALDFRGLAVISACGSALGPARFGDDSPANLGGAFLWAGARAVVLPRTALHFESSMALLAIFYEHLQRGEAPAEALRAAREQRAEDGENPLLDFQRVPLQVLGLGHVPLVR